MKPKYLMLLASLPVTAPVGILLLPTALAMAITFLFVRRHEAPYLEVYNETPTDNEGRSLLLACAIVFAGVICNIFWSNWLTSII